jgi:hypothetical protein
MYIEWHACWAARPLRSVGNLNKTTHRRSNLELSELTFIGVKIVEYWTCLSFPELKFHVWSNHGPTVVGTCEWKLLRSTSVTG